MNKLNLKRLLLLLLIIFTTGAGVYWGISRRRSTPDAIIRRVKAMKHLPPNIQIIDVIWVGRRLVVQTQYAGPDTEAPQAAHEWHRLAQNCAEQIHLELSKKHAVEIQLFHHGEFRAVSIAGT